MRFQPSWILESLPAGEVDSLFLPLAPRAPSLLWFKRRGLRIYANDPVESRAMLLRALVQNQGELFSEENRRKFNQVIRKPLDLAMNPFRTWEDRPFSRAQLDYLFYWREAALEIPQVTQRELFWAAAWQVMAYWVGLARVGQAPALAPDEAMAVMLDRQKDLVFAGQEPVYALNLPLGELGEEVEAGVFLLPLLFPEKIRPENDLEVLFHAWFRGAGDLLAARTEIEQARRGWVQRWDAAPAFPDILRKAGHARFAVVTWSGSDLPPRFHEEAVADPVRRAFAGSFPVSTLRCKAASRHEDDYDFLLVMKRASPAGPTLPR